MLTHRVPFHQSSHGTGTKRTETSCGNGTSTDANPAAPVTKLDVEAVDISSIEVILYPHCIPKRAHSCIHTSIPGGLAHQTSRRKQGLYYILFQRSDFANMHKQAHVHMKRCANLRTPTPPHTNTGNKCEPIPVFTFEHYQKLMEITQV